MDGLTEDLGFLLARVSAQATRATNAALGLKPGCASASTPCSRSPATPLAG